MKEDLDGLWRELEQQAPRSASGRMQRRLHSAAPVELQATIQLRGPAGARRALELVTGSSILESLRVPDPTALVDITTEPRGPALSALIVALDDPAALQLFAALCQDMVRAVADTTTAERAAGALIARFELWRRLLRGGRAPLSPQEQRGLFTELRVIQEHLAPRVGVDAAITGWLGPAGAPRDFEIDGVGIEAKSNASNQPQIVTINGERQLDDHGLRGLLLIHLSLEAISDGHPTLPEQVDALRHMTRDRPSHGHLEDGLLQAGYLDVDAHRYTRTGWSTRRTSVLRVAPGFPRLTEADLPDGIGRLTYHLAIDAARDHEVPEGVLDELLA